VYTDGSGTCGAAPPTAALVGCYGYDGEALGECECHASCAACGYADDPRAPVDCLACADGSAVAAIYDDGSGACGDINGKDFCGGVGKGPGECAYFGCCAWDADRDACAWTPGAVCVGGAGGGGDGGGEDDGPCDSTESTDVYGDGCDWYADNVGSCGLFDDSDFAARDLCCACQGAGGDYGSYDNDDVLPYDGGGDGGGEDDGPCDSTESTDVYGDGCDWYAGNVGSCGLFDDNDFAARDLCCVCAHDYWDPPASVDAAASAAEILPFWAFATVIVATAVRRP